MATAASLSRELKEIEKKKTRAISKSDFAEASRLCNSAGELLSTNGFYSEAVEWHKEEVTCSEVANDNIGAAVGHRKIGECLCELSDFEGALKHQRKFLKISESLENKVEEQRALATLGRTLFLMSDSCSTDLEREKCLKESLDVYLKSFSLANKLRDKVSTKEMLEMRARLCLNIGLVYEWRNQLDQAEVYMEKALVSSRENGLKDNMYRCYLSLSGVTAKNQKLQESLRHAKRAQHIAKEKGSKTMEADAVLQLGQTFIKIGAFQNAVNLIRQSYKMHPPTLESDRKTLLESLKIAVTGEKCMKQLEGDVSDDVRLKLVEQLGDVFSEAKSPEKALGYYKQQLELCHKLDKGDRVIAAVYISLAITYAENGEVQNALEYYQKELDLRNSAGLNNDFKEISATFSAMAKLLEDSKEEQGIVIQAYSKAVECAEKSGSASCLLRVYKELRETYRKFGMDEDYKEIVKKISKLQKEYDEDMEEDSQDIKEEESENLEGLLEFSDSSDEETTTRKSKNKRRTKASKVNERGETPLHLACISGNLQRVKELLQTGSSVHSRDFCGWQSLHEACNFGHSEIAALLLAYGASVNDTGGDHCAQVTPLHDAAQNGHLETVKLLVKHGANPFARDARGRTPRDLVELAIKADEEELEGSESELLQSRRDVRDFLRRTMNKSSSEPQLRDRYKNVLEQFAEEDAESSDDEMPVPRIAKVPGRDSRRWRGRIDDCSEDYQACTDHQPLFGQPDVANGNPLAEREAQSTQSRSFEKASSNIDDAVSDNGGTDEDSTYASMDEDGPVMHSPIKPLEPMGNVAAARQQSSADVFDVQSRVDVVQVDTNDLVAGPSHRQSISDYPSSSEHITPFTSESDSDKEELIDGFIIDDVGQKQARKKRRIDGFPRKKSTQQKITIPGSSSVSSSYRPTSNSTNTGPRLQSIASKPKRKKQTRITGTYATSSHRQSNQPSQSAVRNSFTVNNGACSSGTISHFPDEASNTFDLLDLRQVNQPMMAPSLRVRVRIDKEQLLIPCVEDGERKTIKWLSDQASQRYSSTHGVTPRLKLKTTDGACLCETDLVTDVLGNNEEVIGEVLGWNSGSLCEKYQTECTALGIGIRDDILKAMSLENELNQLSLQDFNLDNPHLKALSRSIAGHSNLSKIDVTGNFVGDEGIKFLCDSINYLPNLKALNLSCTGTTSNSLQIVVSALRRRSKYFSGLQDHQEKNHLTYFSAKLIILLGKATLNNCLNHLGKLFEFILQTLDKETVAHDVHNSPSSCNSYMSP
eukprot:gene1570-16021_t